MGLQFFGSKFFVIGALILAIWVLGGMGFVMNNPIIILFGLFFIFIMMMGGKK